MNKLIKNCLIATLIPFWFAAFLYTIAFVIDCVLKFPIRGGILGVVCFGLSVGALNTTR